ncbi:MAG: hypothetical protein DRG33_07235, partial [Deltaproteobacteria bacterium]
HKAPCAVDRVKLQYRIWYRGNWTEWMNYTGNITFDEHCTHYLEVRAIDCLGNTAIDNETFIVHDEVGEHPTLVSPECGAVFNSTPITLVWNQVSDYENYRVEWSTDSSFSTNVFYANVTGDNYTINSLADGKWYWHVAVIYTGGTIGDWSETRYFILDTTPPVISDIEVIYPVDQYTVREGQTLTIKANVTDDYLQDVIADCTELGAGAVDMTVEGGDTYTCQCTLVNTSGDFIATVTVIATDMAGNSASLSTDVIVDNTPPFAEITNPTYGDIVSGIITVDTVVTDDHLELTELYLDNLLINSSTSASPSFILNTTGYADGGYTLKIIAYDDAGNVNMSDIYIIIDNQAPHDAVIITPHEGDVLSGTIHIEVSVSDTIEVDYVRFYDGSNVLGVDDDGAPWYYDWSTTQSDDGPHDLKAVVTDTAGHATNTSIVHIIVDNTPPVISSPVTIYPTGQQTVREGQTVAVSAEVTDDNIDSVVADFTQLGGGDAIPMSCSSGSTYVGEYTLVGTSGEYTATVTITATDKAGNTATATTKVIVDNISPTAEITSPPDGRVVRGEINVTTEADDSHLELVEFYVGTDLVSTSTSPNPTFILNTSMYTNGEWILTIKVYDDAGNINVSDGVAIIIDNQAPDNAIIVRPDDGDYISGTVTIEVSAGDAINVSNVTFYYDDTLLGVDYAAPWTMDWDTTTVPDGAHVIKATVFDTAGNSINATPITVYVDNTPPTISLWTDKETGPTHPISGSLLLNATADDTNGIEKVVFQIKPVRQNRIHLATITTGDDSNYIYVLDTTEFTDGNYTVYATAYDHVGNYEDDWVKITIDNTPPSVTITNPSPGSVVDGTVNITFNVNDLHDIVERNVIIDGAEYSTSYNYYLWNSTTTYDGAHYIMVKAVDKAGNVGYSMPIMVSTDNVDESDPIIHIVYPTNGTAIEVNELNRGYLRVKIDAYDDKTSKENLTVKLWIPGGRRDAPTLWYNVTYNPSDG